MKTTRNTSKKLNQAPHEELKSKKQHYPTSPNHKWRDYNPAQYFVQEAFFAKCSVEDFIEIYYS